MAGEDVAVSRLRGGSGRMAREGRLRVALGGSAYPGASS